MKREVQQSMRLLITIEPMGCALPRSNSSQEEEDDELWHRSEWAMLEVTPSMQLDAGILDFIDPVAVAAVIFAPDESYAVTSKRFMSCPVRAM